MQINVSQLLQEPIGASREYRVNEVVNITGDKEGSTVKGKCHLLRTQRSILTRCSLDTDISLACSRCLSQFNQNLHLDFEEEYVPTVDVATGAPLPPPEETSTFTIDKNHILDLTEAVRQYSLLAVPMKPLCSKECAGICPNCGKNLNEGTCDCPKQDVDPRWAELMKLL
jgi:uncharacterized protein